MSTLEDDVLALALLKKKQKFIAQQVEDLQAEVIAKMAAKGSKSTTVKNGNEIVKATVVTSSVIDIDENRLKKALGASVFNKLTKRVLDKAKLEDGMATGEVDPLVVAQCSEEKPRKPYVKVSS